MLYFLSEGVYPAGLHANDYLTLSLTCLHPDKSRAIFPLFHLKKDP
jgi:hypothetical protein